MKLKKIFAPLLCAALMATGNVEAATTGTAKPKKQDVLSAMRLANDHYMNKWTDPGQSIAYPSRKKSYESNLWTRGCYYVGLTELWKIDPQKRYIDYMVDWGEKHNWQLRGTKNGVLPRNADNLCAGQTYIFLYQNNPSHPDRYIKAIRSAIDTMMASNKIDDWTWIDAVHMAMPIFIQMGNLTGNKAYYERAYDMYEYTKTKHGGNGLFNPKDGLWWRDADFDPPYKEPNGEDCYWSRGNGWIVMAMCRALELLPKDADHRKEYEDMLVTMCEALKKVQREDGLWNVSLHDPNNYGGKELTGTAMFTYGMAYGVNHGLLNAKEYKPIIYKAWNAMVNDCLHKDGFLGYVQGSGKEPKEAQPVTYDREPDFDDYGLGAFLMAGTEIYRMK